MSELEDRRKRAAGGYPAVTREISRYLTEQGESFHEVEDADAVFARYIASVNRRLAALEQQTHDGRETG